MRKGLRPWVEDGPVWRRRLKSGGEQARHGRRGRGVEDEAGERHWLGEKVEELASHAREADSTLWLASRCCAAGIRPYGTCQWEGGGSRVGKS